LKVGYRNIGLLAVALAGVAGIAYTLGQKPAERSAAAGAAAPSPTKAAAAVTPQSVASPPALGLASSLNGATAPPPNHPAVPGDEAPAATEREGKVAPDPNAKFVHFRVGTRNVKGIYRDGNVLWIGTSGGVIRYDTSNDQFKLFDSRNGLLSNGIFHVGKLDGRIVVGTYGGGMSIYDEPAEKWETYNVPEGLGDAFVYGLLKAKNGDLWIATWSGVNRVRGGALKERAQWDLFTVDNTKGGLPNDWVYGLAEGRNGDIWLATEGGLGRFRGGKWENWNHAKGLGAAYDIVKGDPTFKNDPAKVSSHHAKQKQEMGLQGIDTAYNPNYIVSLVVDGDGVVWAGTWGAGLARFDGTRWRNYTMKDGLPGNHVFMLNLDPKGTLWIGTNNGLARRGGEKFDVLTTADGLFSNTVFSMAAGRDGDIWVGSFGGVAHLKFK
jgi:ligand-binding sensor domain-containing protein